MTGIGQFLLSSLGATVAVGSFATIRLRLPPIEEKLVEGE